MKKFPSQIILGIIIIVVGILLLLRSTGIIDMGNVIRFLPSIFILIGIYSLIKSKFRNITESLLFITLFTVIQLWILNIITLGNILAWWPIILIIIGVGIILSRLRGPPGEEDSHQKLDIFTFFGEVKRNIKSNNFQGGDITAVFGEINLDLRDATLSETPRINVVSLFAEVNIKVPEEWNVNLDTQQILADVQDKSKESPANDEITVGGLAIFSEVNIRN
ncbi:MAG: cell wall-active antibiotics response protein [Euryarchaeota archaeon]|nr:cell wall-active antibiotics response protein [Euryarchaeota archaeon]MBU4607627.1 cell wall-active antibiotics response protein [Euryarchaeota archaeon]MBV1754202.1 cell wall-active antibiotics response protein [Methanobacterium sp.]MBV1768368.1 cell wall-active antibiotics response protein [Methanobacterium sp.]